MRVRYGERVADEVVKTNIGEGTTEVDTKDDQGRDVIIYNDFHKVTGKISVKRGRFRGGGVTELLK